MKKWLSMILSALLLMMCAPLGAISVAAETASDHSYQLFDLGMTWQEAKAYCESLGGHLVTITSQEEQDIVHALLENGSKNSYWLGGYLSGGWTWVTGESFDYTNWAPGQPDDYMREDALMIYRYRNPLALSNKMGQWNDLQSDGTCNNEAFFGVENFGFICEWEPAAPDEPKILYGDANSDGQINNQDLGLLQQYLTEWDVALNLDACDVNKDGKINNHDLGLLQRYLNGWKVELG